MLEDQIAHFEKRARQLRDMREKATNAHDGAITALQERLLSGDIDDPRGLGKLRDAVVSSATELVSIDDALVVLDRQKAEADAKLAAEREHAERLKVSADIAASTDGIEAQVAKTLPVLRELGDALVGIDHLSFEAGQLGRYLLAAGSQTELALPFVLPDLRRLAEAVSDGKTAIPHRPQSEESGGIDNTSVAGDALAEDDLHGDFVVLDRSAESRTLQISVPRS